MVASFRYVLPEKFALTIDDADLVKFNYYVKCLCALVNFMCLSKICTS